MDYHRILAIDYGDKRIGLAVSDPLRISAQMMDSILVTKQMDPLVEIKKIVLTKNIREIVVGFPLSMNGEEGIRAKLTREWFEKLKDSIPECQIHLWDERMTSKIAEKAMLEANLSRKKRKENSDKIAALLILQNYLDRLSSGFPPNL